MVTYTRCDSDGSIVVLEWVPSENSAWPEWWLPIMRRDNVAAVILGPLIASDPYAGTEWALTEAVRISPSLGEAGVRRSDARTCAERPAVDI